MHSKKSKIIWLATLLLVLFLVGCASGLDIRTDHYIFEGESAHWKAKLDYSYKQVFYENPETKRLEYDCLTWSKFYLYFQGPEEKALDVSWDLKGDAFGESGSGFEFQKGRWAVASSSYGQKERILDETEELTLTVHWEGKTETISLKARD
ncbi:MAG: hypothetical protein QMD88_03730 [Coprothermobacterota bacterium]|nr:hypothetical protein [Coprothermobacterota bacterium]